MGRFVIGQEHVSRRAAAPAGGAIDCNIVILAAIFTRLAIMDFNHRLVVPPAVRTQ